MNKQIKELAIKAGLIAPYGSDLEGLREFDYRMFAELIVQECANIVRSRSLPDSYSEACLGLIADELEEHFGVNND